MPKQEVSMRHQDFHFTIYFAVAMLMQIHFAGDELAKTLLYLGLATIAYIQES